MGREMFDKCVKVLAGQPAGTQWVLQQTESEADELYASLESIECVRHVSDGVTGARLIVDRDADGASGRSVGQASVSLLEGDDVRRRIDSAREMAMLNRNPHFTLPGAASYPAVEIMDPRLGANSREMLSELHDMVRKAIAREKSIRLASLEIVLKRDLTRLSNSSGASGEYRHTVLIAELTVAAFDGAKEEESCFQLTARRWQDLRMEELVAEAAKSTVDKIHGTLPRTGTLPVLIAGKVMETIFKPLAFHASGEALYNGTSFLKEGESVCRGQEIRGEKLTMSVNATLPFGVATRPFDDDGFPGMNVPVCEDGIFRNRWATKQYADYLGIKATGNAGNIVVRPGVESFTSLRETLRPGLYVEQFALVWPDRMSGDFASEIRIGYEIDAVGRARPIKGGSVSGNIFDGLLDARFSRETVLYGFYGQYHGPKAVLFKGLAVAGQP